MDGREGPAWHPVTTWRGRPAAGGPVAVPGGYDGPPASRSGVRIPPFMTLWIHRMNGQ